MQILLTENIRTPENALVSGSSLTRPNPDAAQNGKIRVHHGATNFEVPQGRKAKAGKNKPACPSITLLCRGGGQAGANFPLCALFCRGISKQTTSMTPTHHNAKQSPRSHPLLFCLSWRCGSIVFLSICVFRAYRKAEIKAINCCVCTSSIPKIAANFRKL